MNEGLLDFFFYFHTSIYFTKQSEKQISKCGFTVWYNQDSGSPKYFENSISFAKGKEPKEYHKKKEVKYRKNKSGCGISWTVKRRIGLIFKPC